MRFGWGGCQSEEQFKRDKRERAAARRRRNAAEQAFIARSTDKAKLKILARAICTAATARGTICLTDLLQSGVSQGDAERLYDQALQLARRLYPSLDLDAIGAMP